MQIDSERYPKLADLFNLQLKSFPDHRAYLNKRFENANSDEFEFAEDISEKVLHISGSQIERVCRDYMWLCGEILEEELYFRRNGRYQISTFSEALTKVYGNHDFMAKYVNGILASQLWWHNHTEMLRFHRDEFVAGHPRPFNHLEIGPGHGLYLYFAAVSPKCERAEGWDVSDASLEATTGALNAMGVSNRVKLTKFNFLEETPTARFRSITFSEVLEHLEDPLAALKKLHTLLDEGGRIFVNAPVNSPAPDHIYLFRTPEEVVKMMERAGFKIEKTLFSPCTGASLGRARKLELSISAGVVATK